jgi:hypothetical protein
MPARAFTHSLVASRSLLARLERARCALCAPLIEEAATTMHAPWITVHVVDALKPIPRIRVLSNQ